MAASLGRGALSLRAGMAFESGRKGEADAIGWADVMVVGAVTLKPLGWAEALEAAVSA